MKMIKGDRLYVELGASQARRRLKHFGHGVRKVEAVGRKQSVIIHTATGEHLRELEAFLADVIPLPPGDKTGKSSTSGQSAEPIAGNGEGEGDGGVLNVQGRQ